MRLPDSILSDGIADMYLAPQSDIRLGGQNGFSQNLGEWLNNSAYVRKPVFGLLLTAPEGVTYMSDPDWWISTLKNLVELRPKSISGLNSKITNEFLETQLGWGGEQQYDFSGNKREQSSVSMTWDDIYGGSIGNFWEQFTLWFMADPLTGIAGISTLEGTRPTDMLPDMYSFTMLYIEPDRTMQSVVRSWLISNMAPKDTGDHEGKRDMGSQDEKVEHSIEFTGFQQVGLGPNLLAQAIMDEMNISNANGFMAPAYLQGVSADVAAANGGYITKMEELGASAMTSRP